MAKKRISIDQLALDMYVCELDISWLDSPFLTNSKKITKAADITALRKSGVKQLCIDTIKGCDIKVVSEEPEVEQEPDHLPQIEVAEITPVALEQELKAACQLKDQVMGQLGGLFEQLHHGCAKSAMQLLPAVDQTMDSLARNDQALMTLLHIQQQNEALLNHHFNTMALSLGIAKQLKLDKEQQTSLAHASLLHDCGWLELSEKLFTSDNHSAEQVQEALLHIQISVNRVMGIGDLPDDVVSIVAQHEERCDGKGQPEGLLHNEINSLAKILMVSSCYNHHINGTAGFSKASAASLLAMLYKASQSGCFDTQVCTALIKLLGVYPVGSPVLLSSGEKGMVIETNKDQPNLPRVKVFYDRTGVANLDGKCVSLAKQNTISGLHIKSILNLSDHNSDPARLLVLSL